MGQNSTKEMRNRMKVQGDPGFATELNLFFNRFDTTPTPVCSDSVSRSPPTITAPIHTFAGDSVLLPIKDMATSPSLSTPITSVDSPFSTSSCLLPNTNMSMDGGASQPLPLSMTCQPLLEFHNSLHPTSSPSPTLTSSQVERELSKHRTNKPSGPDNISLRVLRACSGQLAGAFQHLFSLSLILRKVPKLWKTSCIVPVPKKGRYSALSYYRTVALTSYVMKNSFLVKAK